MTTRVQSGSAAGAQSSRGSGRSKLSARQRAQVVELLRCAADGLSATSTGAWTDACDGLDIGIKIQMFAISAFVVVAGWGQFSSAEWEDGRAAYLEAALRVEEGSWP